MNMRRLGFINSILMAAAFLLALAMPAAAADPPGVVPALVHQEMKPGETITVTKRVTTPSIPPNPDIYFLVDSTGSMGVGSAIDKAKAAVGTIMASVLAVQPTAQFGAGNYKDFPINVSPPTPPNAYAFQHQQGITSNTTAVTNAVGTWTANAGGDGSEGWLYALTKIAIDPAIGWRSGSTKIVIIVGDSPAHDPIPVNAAGTLPPEPPSQITEATTTAALVAADIRVIAVSLPTGGYPNGLDDDPKYYYNGEPLGFQDYFVYPGYIPGGTPGQASRITFATGGAYFLSPTADEVAAKILSGLQSFKTDVWATVVADPSLSVTITPPVQYAVPLGTTVNFTETVTFSGTTPGQYNATVSFWANNYPKTGILIGTQKIEVLYPAAPSISVTKTGALDMTVVPPSTQANPGDRINYTFVVTNTGNVPLTNVTVSDVPALTTGLVPPSVALLASGASATFTGTYTLTQADINAGKVDDTATATGTPPTGPPVIGTGKFRVPIPAAPSISVVKTGHLDTNVVPPGNQANPGDKINYTFIVTNTGNVPLTNVTVSDVPALTTALVPPFVASLAPGASATFTGSYTLTQADINAGKVDNTATATGTPPSGPPVTAKGTASIPIPSTAVCDGRMTGGGSVFTSAGDRVTHGFELHCDPATLPNNLEVNWGKGNKFHLEKLDTANCFDDPNIVPNPPAAGFDTLEGSGRGRYNGESGATIKFTFTDAGEPGKKDTATITIWDSKGNVVLTVTGFLQNGNHQAHKS